MSSTCKSCVSTPAGFSRASRSGAVAASGGAACKAPSCAGMLLPLAYAPTAASLSAPIVDGLLLDCLVTALVYAGTVVNCRLYPQSEGYSSTSAVMISFISTACMWPGDLLRVAVVAVDGGAAGLFELQHRQRNSEWVRIADAVPIRIGFSDTCTCYVFFTTNASGACEPVAPVCAIGLRTRVGEGEPIEPILPPPCVLPCTATVVADVAPGDTGVWFTAHIGDALLQNTSVPADWRNAWTLVKWSAAWASTADLAALTSAVEVVEDALAIRLVPGQLMPVAFRAYELVLAPTNPGEAAFVVTRRVPPTTTVYIWANAWADIDVNSVLSPPWWWSWTSPPTCLEPGTVVTLSGLGAPFTPRASTGTLIASTSVPLVSITALTLFSLDLRPKAWPITGIYTCAYESSLPDEFVLGESIRAVPWPIAPSIIQPSPCTRIDDWACERFAIAHAPVQRWTCQAPPLFAANAKRDCFSCSCCKPADASAYRLRGV
jgi:hypothetical protein